MYYRSKMLQYLVSNLPGNFVGVTLDSCIVPIKYNECLVRITNNLYTFNPIERLCMTGNRIGELTFMRCGLITGTCIRYLAAWVSYELQYLATPEVMSPQTVAEYVTTLVKAHFHVYPCTLVYTLYSYADEQTKQVIEKFLDYKPQPIGRKSTILEQLNDIPLECRIKWYITVTKMHNFDLKDCFSSGSFLYELAVTVLDTLINSKSHNYRLDVLCHMRNTLDSKDILKLYESPNFNQLTVLIDAVDREVISVDELCSRLRTDTIDRDIIYDICSNNHPQTNELHKVTALLLIMNSLPNTDTKRKVLSKFTIDNCKFCAKIRYE